MCNVPCWSRVCVRHEGRIAMINCLRKISTATQEKREGLFQKFVEGIQTTQRAAILFLMAVNDMVLRCGGFMCLCLLFERLHICLRVGL